MIQEVIEIQKYLEDKGIYVSEIAIVKAAIKIIRNEWPDNNIFLETFKEPPRTKAEEEEAKYQAIVKVCRRDGVRTIWDRGLAMCGISKRFCEIKNCVKMEKKKK